MPPKLGQLGCQSPTEDGGTHSYSQDPGLENHTLRAVVLKSTYRGLRAWLSGRLSRNATW